MTVQNITSNIAIVILSISKTDSDIGTLYADIQCNCTTMSEILFLYNSSNNLLTLSNIKMAS